MLAKMNCIVIGIKVTLGLQVVFSHRSTDNLMQL